MFVARAPGKVVALGEYAVLDGAPAVVLAIDRYVEAAIGPSPDGACRLTTRAAEVVERQFAPGEASGAPLIDLVAAAVEPPLVYWNGATVECLHAVRRLRAGGVPVFFTIDAGPQLKAVCEPGSRAVVEAALREVPGVLELSTSALGPGAELY